MVAVKTPYFYCIFYVLSPFYILAKFEVQNRKKLLKCNLLLGAKSVQIWFRFGSRRGSKGSNLVHAEVQIDFCTTFFDPCDAAPMTSVVKRFVVNFSLKKSFLAISIFCVLWNSCRSSNVTKTCVFLIL